MYVYTILKFYVSQFHCEINMFILILNRNKSMKEKKNSITHNNIYQCDDSKHCYLIFI